MAPMSLVVRDDPVQWYRSLYFRIGFSFVLFLAAVLLAQGAVFRYTQERRFIARSPNNLSTTIAADLGSTLAQNPSVDVGEYLKREYGGFQPIYVVFRDASIASNRSAPLEERYRRTALAVLAGTDLRGTAGESGPAFVTAPIQVANELRGMVVLPPGPAPNPVLRDVGRLASPAGTALLIAIATLAAAFIFGPARRRLKALEHASQKLGAGDLTARASTDGGDEIAHVAAAFNRMAADLGARDEALRSSDHLRRQMLADVSHELKTPLTAMRGYVETLHMSDVALDAATRERYFATLERETLRLDRIVRDLIDLARLENGVARFEPRLFAIGRVFEHVVHRHEYEAQARQVALRTSITDAADQLFADPHRIEQVVENLVSNALRHTSSGGTVKLEATADDRATVLSVVDTGPGIPPEHAPHVFERFYKVDAARANGSEGSGLGLCIAKAIVDQHRGSIGVTSVPGRTAFTVTLPREPDDDAQSTSTNL
jgi:signal transduction histidine kinase